MVVWVHGGVSRLVPSMRFRVDLPTLFPDVLKVGGSYRIGDVHGGISVMGIMAPQDGRIVAGPRMRRTAIRGTVRRTMAIR